MNRLSFAGGFTSKDLTHKPDGSQDEKLDQIIVAIRALDTRLEGLETKVEERLKDTRPMWEAVQVQLTELRSEFKTDLGELRSEFKADLEKLRNETEKGFRKLKHIFELQGTTLAELHADWRDHEERLDKLEKDLNTNLD